MALLETEYEEREDGTIAKVYIYNREEFARMTDVYEWYKRANLYTDTCDTRSKVAIGFSIASIIISLIACIICLVI